MRAIWIIFCCFFALKAMAQVQIEKIRTFPADTFPEDSPTIAPDGKSLVFLVSQSQEWPEMVNKKAYFLSLTNSKVRLANGPDIDSLYTISFGRQPKTFFVSRRAVLDSGDVETIYKAEYFDGAWHLTNLSKRYGIEGGYPFEVGDGSLYFFQYDGPEGTGLYRSQKQGEGFEKPQWLGNSISEPGSVTFGAFVAPDESWMVFTAYFEADGEQGRTGFYFAQKQNGQWVKRKLKGLPYGWGANITPDRKDFIFTDGNDLFRCALRDVIPEIAK